MVNALYATAVVLGGVGGAVLYKDDANDKYGDVKGFLMGVTGTLIVLLVAENTFLPSLRQARTGPSQSWTADLVRNPIGVG